MTNKKARGKRAKTRRKLRAGDKKTVNQLIKVFSEKEGVQICIDSAVHSGMPTKKYHGFNGEVVGTRGAAFEVTVRDGNTPRTLVVGAAHLKSLKVAKA